MRPGRLRRNGLKGSKLGNKHEEISMSAKFFSCKEADCPGAMCLGCNKLITKDDRRDKANESVRLFVLCNSV